MRILLFSEVTLLDSKILSPIFAISNAVLEALLFCCLFARDRHGGPAGLSRIKAFLSSGSLCKFFQKKKKNIILFSLPTWPPCHTVANQEFPVDKKIGKLTCFVPF